MFATVSLLLGAALAAGPPQDTILDIQQVGNRLEILVTNPDRDLGELWIRQGGINHGPIRLAQGENRYSYDILRQGQALAQRWVTVKQFNANQEKIDHEVFIAIEPWDAPAHPVLALTPADVRLVVKRYYKEQRAGVVLQEVIDESYDKLLSGVYIPAEGGTWTQDYRCPDHRVFLQLDAPTVHRCPVDDKIWSGQVFDRAGAVFIHKDLGVEALKAGLSYQITQDPAFANRVHDILIGYAQQYEGYEEHDREGNPSTNGGKAFGQSLDEAVWLVDLLRGYDLVRGSGALSAAEEVVVKEQLFRPAMELIQGTTYGIHNIQVWHNTAVFMAALYLGEPVSAQEAWQGPLGLGQQLAQGVKNDGLWHEGSFGYHFFTFRGMLPMLQALSRLGLAGVGDISALERMLLMPLSMNLPDGTLPQVNDGTVEDFTEGLRNDYEQALGFFKSPELVTPLVLYGRGRSFQSVIYGLADLPFQDWYDPPSINFQDSGLTALRNGPTDYRSTGILDYGAHGGAHGHLDKLGVMLWHRQRPAVIESGAVGFGTTEAEGYFRRTLAHSTVVIDGQDQAECTGQLEYFGTQGENSLILASANDAYPGTLLRRQILLSSTGHLADGFLVEAPQTSTIDYVLHGTGSIELNIPLVDGNTGFTGAYEYLTGVRRGTTDGRFRATFKGPEGDLVLDFTDSPGTEVFVAEAPVAPLGSTHPVLIVRRTTDRTVFSMTVTESGSMVDGFRSFADEDSADPAMVVHIDEGPTVRLPFYR